MANRVPFVAGFLDDWSYDVAILAFVVAACVAAARLRLPIAGRLAFVLLAVACGPLGIIGAHFRTGPIALLTFAAIVGCVLAMTAIWLRRGPQVSKDKT